MKCPCEDEMYLCETPCNKESCAYQQGKNDGRADAFDEVCKQISERVNYWDNCANAVDKGSNEYKIFMSLAKNFKELLEQLEQLKSQNSN